MSGNGSAPAQWSSSDRRSSPARGLVAVYVIFVLAAGGRATVQLATRAAEAPLAYGLSAVAAAIYLVGAIVMFRAERDTRLLRTAVVFCVVELLGVIVVGSASLALPQQFRHATVWSLFGVGYGFVPLVLPLLGLTWAYCTSRAKSSNPTDR